VIVSRHAAATRRDTSKTLPKTPPDPAQLSTRFPVPPTAIPETRTRKKPHENNGIFRL